MRGSGGGHPVEIGRDVARRESRAGRRLPRIAKRSARGRPGLDAEHLRLPQDHAYRARRAANGVSEAARSQLLDQAKRLPQSSPETLMVISSPKLHRSSLEPGVRANGARAARYRRPSAERDRAVGVEGPRRVVQDLPRVAVEVDEDA
jgi:hypothetical protein